MKDGEKQLGGGDKKALLHRGAPSSQEQVESLRPLITEADLKPISPRAALLGRKMGQAGPFFSFLCPVFERKGVGVLNKYAEAL